MKNFLSVSALILRVSLQKALFLPLLASVLMVFAGISPWLHDPLGSLTTAWQVPIDTGWQIHTPLWNYGLLCTAVAVAIDFLTVAHSFLTTQRLPAFTLLSRMHALILLCLMPAVLFLGQMLCCDFSSMALLARHAQQALLVQRLFLYPGVDQLIPLRPFVLHDSTLWGRLQLLIDYLDYGPLLLFLACFLLVFWTKLSLQKRGSSSASQSTYRWHTFLLSLAFLFLFCLLFARAFVGLTCEKLAQSALASGAYTPALSLLHTASFFLPELNAAAFYHLECGQALYYLSPQQLSPDAQAYLAAAYRAQRDFSSAFQQDYTLWKTSPSTPWVSYELSETLEAWVDGLQSLKSPLPSELKTELKNSTNIYALYLEGRSAYAFHDYSASLLPFSRLLLLCREPAILSSVYTYLAFDEIGLGDAVAGRALLFKALTFDPGYRNNTAREALSGLH